MPNPRKKKVARIIPVLRVVVRDDSLVDRATDLLIQVAKTAPKYDDHNEVADFLSDLADAVADLEWAIALEQCGPVVRRQGGCG